LEKPSFTGPFKILPENWVPELSTSARHGHVDCIHDSPFISQTLNDLLLKQGIDPAQVIVMRHSPKEKKMRKVMPWLVHEKPEVFSAYQRSRSGLVENALNHLAGSGYLASFIGLKPGTAVLAGLYRFAVRFRSITSNSGTWK
jgi:hypothetical protein